jgi:hypothetical protein
VARRLKIGIEGAIMLAPEIIDNGAMTTLIFGGDPYRDGLKLVTPEPATLQLNMTEADLSNKNLGVGGAIIISAWLTHKDKGALSVANIMGNRIGKEMLSKFQEIMRSKPSLISLCGIADDATAADLSGLGMDADDAGILASELPGKRALNSLNLANNSLSAESFMESTELYVEEKLVTTSVAEWAPTPHQALPSDRLEVVSASPPLADGDIANVAEVLGKIVMVSRGGCSFVVKAQRLQAAGAGRYSHDLRE